VGIIAFFNPIDYNIKAIGKLPEGERNYVGNHVSGETEPNHR
jgi:hypothetical protein